MKTVYPIIITETKDRKVPYLVYVPDVDLMTQGTSLSDAIEMAKDVISLAGIEGEITKPSDMNDIDVKCSPWYGEEGTCNEFKTLVTIDIELYRQKYNNKFS